MAQIKFSGFLPSTADFGGVGTTQFHEDPGIATTQAPIAASVGFIPPSCTAVGLTVHPLSNTTAASTTFAIFKNGSATGITVTVGSGSTTIQIDNSHTATFDGTTDTLDLVSTRTGSLATRLKFSAIVSTTPL